MAGKHRKISWIAVAVLWFVIPVAHGNEIRVGTLKFGTVNWELDTVKHHGFDRSRGLEVKTVSFANKQAGHILFQNQAVDVIVTDWVWVSRQRFNGRRFSFIPYSAALGSVMVPPGAGIKDLRDLRGMRLGIAGGAHDKSWLLLQAWTRKHHQLDLLESTEPQYAAPPLLNGQIERGHLDAVLNYWHYCARLEAEGYERLAEIDMMAQSFTPDGAKVPLVGYVFREQWARQNPGLIEKFNDAVREARQLLLDQDREWERVKPLMQVKNPATFMILRDRFREGVPRRWGVQERANAVKMMTVFAEFGGEALTGGNDRLSEGTFWDGVRY